MRRPDLSRVLDFPFTGGRLCLDFVGTLGDRDHRPTERLRDHEDLGRWFVEAGIADTAPTTSAAALKHAREFREALYRAMRAAMADEAAETADVEVINNVAGRRPLAPRFEPDTRRIRWMPGPYTAALAVVARDAVALLASEQTDRIRECAAPDCSLLFLDESRPGARRWCSMARCGNRAKVSAAYQRRATDTRARRR